MKSMKNPGYLLVQVRIRLCQARLGLVWSFFDINIICFDFNEQGFDVTEHRFDVTEQCVDVTEHRFDVNEYCF